MEIPLPDSLPCPLPAFLSREQVALLLEFWNLGGRRYLDKLIANRDLIFVRRPGCKGDRGGRVGSEKVLRLYLGVMGQKEAETALGS